MAKNEKTSKRIGTIASRAMRDPASLTLDEIRALGASATTQRPDRKPAKKTAKRKVKKPTKKTAKKTAKKPTKRRARKRKA
jgi:carnitine O-acetyltransferase